VSGFVDGRKLCAVGWDASVPVRVEALGPSVVPAQVSIRCASVDESLFVSSPVGWSRWRGHVEMTCKWQCDPRWSFLGLWADSPDTRRDAAGIFSRGSYLGDQYLHFNFAFKDMLGGKPRRRRYVRRDLNFAFACEDEDLASGYCLLLGGFGNRGTQLLRRGVLVAESDAFRFPSFDGRSVTDLHWRWFNLEIGLRGGRVKAALDGTLLLDWTDPDPLPGGHVAAWVLGGGMILGRTRFSSAARGEELTAFEESTPDAFGPARWRARGEHVTISQVRPGIVRVAPRRPGGRLAAECVLAGDAPPAALAFRATNGARVAGRLSGGGAPEVTLGAAPGACLPADGRWHVFGLARAFDAAAFGSPPPHDYAAAGIGANGADDWYEVAFFASRAGARAFATALNAWESIRGSWPRRR
jgi:hypothetical protein